jgi:hypothetical protein
MGISQRQNQRNRTSSNMCNTRGKLCLKNLKTHSHVVQVLEETGYNLAGQLDPKDVIELSIKEQKISLYIVPGISEDFPFKTKTRKEISVCVFLSCPFIIAHCHILRKLNGSSCPIFLLGREIRIHRVDFT